MIPLKTPKDVIVGFAIAQKYSQIMSTPLVTTGTASTSSTASTLEDGAGATENTLTWLLDTSERDSDSEPQIAEKSPKISGKLSYIMRYSLEEKFSYHRDYFDLNLLDPKKNK